MDRLLEAMVLAGWTAVWTVGGWLLAAGLFNLRRTERGMVGFGLGLIIEIWLANLLSHVVPVPLAFWLSGVLVLLAGVAAVLRAHPRPAIAIVPAHWLSLALLTLLFTAIGRGLGIFDDYQNLPTVSLMAAGDIPPHFALDPTLRFGYHYLLLLYAAQMMRLGNLLPWSALDLARGVMLALPLVLAGLWIQRLTRRALPSVLGALLLAFAGGARWLLLLLPPEWLRLISDQITLIGSAATTAPNLAEAMISSWKIDGAAPIPFPFAFHSGMNQAYVMGHTGIAGSGILILLLLLFTAQRRRQAAAGATSVALLAALALANEIAFLLLGFGLVIVALIRLMAVHTSESVRGLWMWFGSMAAAVLLAILQGGMLTEIVLARLRQDAQVTSYFDTTPTLSWPPSLVSAHLGSLSLANPVHIILALLEIGPIIFVTPWVLAWGWRALRRGAWLEASLIASSLGVLLAAFVSFKGPLYTAAPRLMSGWFLVSSLYFVPVLWFWLARRRDSFRGWAVGIGAASGLGGLVLFGVQLTAIQRPVYATFITQLDAKVAAEHWNELSPGSLVFDPLVFRAPTVFGRPTRSAPSWYTRSDAWEHLRDEANPQAISDAGFDYIYLDGEYWEQLTPEQHEMLEGECVVPLWQVDGTRSEDDYRKDFRRLVDIRGCR